LSILRRPTGNRRGRRTSPESSNISANITILIQYTSKVSGKSWSPRRSGSLMTVSSIGSFFRN
jgi:hypothetical protein